MKSAGVEAKDGSGGAAAITTFASISGDGAFTSPKKTAVKQSSADSASSSASASSAASAASAASTAAAVDAESLARVQLHNIDLRRRVERLQMSMNVRRLARACNNVSV